jgi:hypothetical protein
MCLNFTLRVRFLTCLRNKRIAHVPGCCEGEVPKNEYHLQAYVKGSESNSLHIDTFLFEVVRFSLLIMFPNLFRACLPPPLQLYYSPFQVAHYQDLDL